ncbi:MAG: hypothetical protein ACE5HA_16675, partial [Anaerolineae bacterium]
VGRDGVEAVSKDAVHAPSAVLRMAALVLVQLGGNPPVVICSKGIARSPSDATRFGRFSSREARIWRSLVSVNYRGIYAVVY